MGVWDTELGGAVARHRRLGLVGGSQVSGCNRPKLLGIHGGLGGAGLCVARGRESREAGMGGRGRPEWARLGGVAGTPAGTQP